MSIRRFRIQPEAYAQVRTWVKRNKPSARDEEKMAEPFAEAGLRVPADYLPAVAWAHKAPFRLGKGAHGKETLEVREGDAWKRLLPQNEIDGWCRDNLLSKTADVPMSRDAGYHIVQKRTVGISRRAFAKFLGKQAVLQITRDALPEKKRVGRPVEARGNLEVDLVEAKGKDIGKFVHHPVRNFYWITLIDRLTGWLEVKRITSKDFKHVVPAIRQMLGRMKKALKTDVKYIRSDSGSEFKSETREMLKSLGIRHKFVKSGARLEQANKTFQKIWYRLMRLGRGDLKELDAQAVAIFNNTKSQVNGRTPLEALDAPDAELVAHVQNFKKKAGRAKYKVGPLQKGDMVRFLLDKVRGKHAPALAYKSYRGKHWSDKVYSVVSYNEARDAYYVASKFRARDKLLKVGGVDAITRDKVKARHAGKSVAASTGFEW